MPSLKIAWAMMGALACTVWCSAQEPKENKDDVFWEVRDRAEAASAVQLIVARNPLTIAVLRDEGLRWKVWREPEFLAETVPPLDGDLLDKIADGTPMPDVSKVKEIKQLRQDQIAVYQIWSQAVVNAFNTPPDAFARSAEDNSHVTFAHLWGNPARYRGQVIPVKGRLARLRKYEATQAAQKGGVHYVYEGWVFGPTERAYPYWILFTHLPEGLKEAETMNREITFNGYFIKKMKYPAADGKKMLEAPVLIGPTVMLTREPPPAPASQPISMMVVGGVVLVIAGVAVGLVLLSWYFQRGDAALKRRLAEMQAERALALLDHNDGPEVEAHGPLPPDSGPK